jgi:hypothetical protein
MGLLCHQCDTRKKLDPDLQHHIRNASAAITAEAKKLKSETSETCYRALLRLDNILASALRVEGALNEYYKNLEDNGCRITD